MGDWRGGRDVAITAATTRIRGVTGDLVPILEWRWSSRLPPRAAGAAVARNAAFESGRAEPCAVRRSLNAVFDRSRGGSADRCAGLQFGVLVTIRSSSAPTATGRSPAFGSPTTGTRNRLVSSGGGQSALDGPVCSRRRRGGHAGAARQPRDGRGVRPCDRRAEVVSRRRGALRVDDCRRRPSRDANHLARARLHPWVDGTAQLPRSRNRPQDLAAGHRAPTISRRSPISAGAARRSPSTI